MSKTRKVQGLSGREIIEPEILGPIDEDVDKLSWEILPKEPAETYQLFQEYLFMGPRRSLEKIATKHNLTYSSVSKSSAKWKWNDRLRAYLAYENKQKLAIDEELNIERIRVYRESIEEARGLFLEEALNLSRQLIAYAKGYYVEQNEQTGEIEIIPVSVNSAKVKACVEALNRAGINPPKEININVAQHVSVQHVDKKKFEEMDLDSAKRALAQKMGTLRARDD